MKVAQYEVLGNEAKDKSVPPAPKSFGVRDDRNARLLISRAVQRCQHSSIVPSGTDSSLKTLTQHFVLGYVRRVPAGLIFSNHQRTSAILIARP
jgi:hypothetical protein